MKYIDLENVIKKMLLDEKMKSKDLLTELNEKYGHNPHGSGLARKIKNKTIRFKEVEEIFDVLGYDISITKRK